MFYRSQKLKELDIIRNVCMSSLSLGGGGGGGGEREVLAIMDK